MKAHSLIFSVATGERAACELVRVYQPLAAYSKSSRNPVEMRALQPLVPQLVPEFTSPSSTQE